VIQARNNILPSDGVWPQSIRTNRKGAGNLAGNPYLDGEAKSPPNQLGAPFVTQADYTTRTLTVYDGIGWGFTIGGLPPGAAASVPEPASMFLCEGAFLLMALARRAMISESRRAHTHATLEPVSAFAARARVALHLCPGRRTGA
jgi:hypothetical protein